VLIVNPRLYAALLAHTPFGRPPASFADWRGPASLSTASSASSTGRAGRAIPVLASPGLAAQLGGRAQSRQLTLARTATMGQSMAQGRWLTLVESTPQLVAVLIGGLICALGLAPLVGPALDLAAFTGSATPVPVRIEPAWVAVTGIGLLVLAMATVSFQTMLTDREVPRSLRIGG
jgi:putative ABC transport system permease protein